MSAFPAKKTIRFGPKPKTPFRRTFLDKAAYDARGSAGPSTSIEYSWDAPVPRMTGSGRFENPLVRFYSEKECKINGFARSSPGPIHAPYSDFGPAPPLPSDHWLLKSSPLIKFKNDTIMQRKARLNQPVLGKDASTASTAAASTSSKSGAPPRPHTRASSRSSRLGTSSTRPSTSGSWASLTLGPRTRKRNAAASPLFPYANADQAGRVTPLPRILK